MDSEHKEELKRLVNRVGNNKCRCRYIDRDGNGMITAVYCKGCGRQIQGMSSKGHLFPYGNYTEMTIVFDDKSAHITPVCKKCVNSKKSREDIEAMYIADLEEFCREEDICPCDDGGKAWDIYMGRLKEKEKILNVS